MKDPFGPDERSRIMRAVKSKDTSPEMAVRRLLFSCGYRYRLHAPDLPGKPDIICRSRSKVIFVHGCFWHGHHCKRGNRIPVANRKYWEGKISRNRNRDRASYGSLRKQEWKILVIWECELKNMKKVERKIQRFMLSGEKR